MVDVYFVIYDLVVAPRTGAWIETKDNYKAGVDKARRPSHRGVD